MSTAVIENFRVVQALSYAARGWRVFPVHHPKLGISGEPLCSCGKEKCSDIGKHPMTVNGLHDATTDPTIIRNWWRRWTSANIGIATGAGSGFFAFDVDAKDGGPESFAALVGQFGMLPETLEVASGSVPNGSHFYFAHPSRRIPNSAKKLGAGLDIRGDGGYVVAPPSLHKSGERYAWVVGRGPDEVELAPAPMWLLAKITEPEQPKPVPRPSFNGRPIPDDVAGRWLKLALERAGEGSRNDTGLWLAAQLRDNGVTEASAEATMREYAQRVPHGQDAYTEREAIATLRQAYKRPPREPARKISYAAKVIRSNPVQEQKPEGAAAELAKHYEDIISRRIFNVPWPWESLTTLTQALVPGTFTVVCGDPGVGKTFFVLQCLRFWIDNGFDPVVFFIEKDRKHHTRRLLAQLEHEGRFINWDWIPENPDRIRSALSLHSPTIDEVGKCIYSSPQERVTLDNLLAWIRQQASAGKRLMVIDPITAVAAGAERWSKDDDFVIAAQSIATAHEASIVLITHAKKGNRPGAPSGHDMAAGAAYFRFADTTIWLVKPKKPRMVKYLTRFGPSQGRIGHFMQLHKTRDGTGQGQELAYLFTGMEYAEQGVVIGDVREEEEAA